MLFAALALGVLLLSLAAAAAPLFVSAAESELLTATIANPAFTIYGSGIAYRATNVRFGARAPDGGSLTQEREAAFVAAAGEDPALGPVIASLAAPPVRVTGSSGEDPRTGPIFGRLFAGSDVLAHVRILSGSNGDGVWLPDYIADPVGARPGDIVQLHDGSHTVSVRMNGSYQALYSAPSDGYWRPWSPDILLPCVDCPLPAQFILAGRRVLEDLQRGLGRPIADEAWQAPVRAAPPLQVGEARALAGFGDALEARMHPGTGPLGDLFHCCGSFSPGDFGAESVSGFQNGMSGVVDVLDQRAPGVRGPVEVLVLAGLVISLVAIAAGAAFVAAARRDETGFLRARGWSPAGIGARSALEAVLPIVAGAALGWGLAQVAVRAFGPNGPTGADALRDSALGALGAATIAGLTVGLAGALIFIAGDGHRGRARAIASWFPWELLAFAGLWALAPRLRPGAGIARVGGVDQPTLVVFLYPLLLAVGVGILASRLGLLLIARRARSGRAEGVTAEYLATRRLAASGRLTALFFVAVSLAVTVSISAVGLLASIRVTVDAKAKVFVGSDVRVEAVSGATSLSDFPLPITQVQRVPDAGSFDDNSSDRFDLLVIDPATFESAAFWSSSFSDQSLSELMASLQNGVGQAVPILIANDQSHAPTAVMLNRVRVPVEVVGRASSFPGESLGTPLVVMAADAVVTTFHTSASHVWRGPTDFWIRGPTDQAVNAAANPDLHAFFVVTADDVKDIPLVAASVNTLRVIEVLGLVGLLLVVVLVVAYLQARQRARALTSAISYRMSATPRLLRRALVVELAIIVAAATVLGGAIGTFAIPVLLGAIAPLPTVPPAPITVVPWVALLGIGLLLLASAWLGAWAADRTGRRTGLAEMMRVAG